MRTRPIKEGETELLVPEVRESRGPRSSRVPVFFNPDMEFSRDVSVLAVEALVRQGCLNILDGLAGCGARGIRLTREVKGGPHVTLNDWKEAAFDLIRKNIAANGLDNAEASLADLNSLLFEHPRRFDYIDIDPFGTPVPFLDAALQNIRRHGTLAVTATDTAPLCGTYPRVCLRRYLARSLKRTPFYNEAGLRTLVGYCVRQAARYDKGLRPVLSHATDHYFRTYLKAEKGVRAAEESLALVGYLDYDPETGSRKTSEEPANMGPLWLGALHDEGFIAGIRARATLGTWQRVSKHLELWREELEGPPYFYTIDEVAKSLKASPPPLSSLLAGLADNGFFASRTHFSSRGFKTDADIGEVRGVFADIAAGRA